MNKMEIRKTSIKITKVEGGETPSASTETRLNTYRTDEIFEGTVAQARELKNITDLCDRCKNRAEKEKGLENKQTEPVQ